MAHLVYTFDAVPINYARSLQLLDEVIQEDPFNLAPIFYKFYIQEKTGDRQGASISKQRMQAADQWDTYSTTINSELLSLVRSPEDYLQFITLTSGLPRASLDQDVQNSIVRHDLNFLADAMIKKNPLPSAPDFVSHVGSDLLELAVALKIKNSSGNPQTSYPTRTDFKNFMAELNAHTSSFFSANPDCDVDQMNRALDQDIARAKNSVLEESRIRR